MFQFLNGNKYFFLLFLGMALSSSLDAQLYLSEKSYYEEIANGPASKVDAVRFLKRGENNQFELPDVSTTFQLSISNPQIEADGISEVLSFGSNSRETMKWPSSEPVFQQMKSIGSPLSSFFTAGIVPGEGIVASSNYGYWLYASIKHLSKSIFPKIGEAQYLADLTVSFNRSVANPVLHIVGMGGIVNVEGIIRGFSVELELVHPIAYLEKVSGSQEFSVSSYKIMNTADRFDSDCGAGGACGSVKVVGTNLNELKFKVYVRRDNREDGYRGRWPLMRNMQGGDGFLIGASFDDNGMVSGSVNLVTDEGVKAQNKLDEKLLKVNLIDPVNNLVLASKAVNDDGSYMFDGLTLDNQYAIQLNSIKGMVGKPAPSTEFPDGWFRTDSSLFLLPLEKANESYLFTLKEASVSGFDFYLTKLSDRKLASLKEKQTVKEPEKTPTEIYIEEKKKLASRDDDSQIGASIPKRTEEPDIAERENDRENVFNEEAESINYAVSVEDNTNGEYKNLDLDKKQEQSSDESSSQAKSSSPQMVSPPSEEYKLTDANLEAKKVIIIGSGINQIGVKELVNKVQSLGKEVYEGSRPNGMTRIGYYVLASEVDDELSWARANIIQDAWILDEEMKNNRSTKATADNAGKSDNYLIIVGSFAKPHNIERMFSRVLDAGFEPFKGDGPDQLTRVGFYVDYRDRFEKLSLARRTFDPESWIKPPFIP